MGIQPATIEDKPAAMDFTGSERTGADLSVVSASLGRVGVVAYAAPGGFRQLTVGAIVGTENSESLQWQPMSQYACLLEP